MDKILQKSNISFNALIVAFLVVFLTTIFSISGITHADNGKATSNGRIITIHDRGSEKLVVSQAATVGDVIKEAGILIDTKDVVEPSLDQKLVASDYQVNIYRARPVIIIDGASRTKIITANQTPEQIAADAGIKLFDEDKVNLGLVDNIVADGAGLQLTIVRATTFQFNLYGNTMTARTFKRTVGEMLIEKGIKLAVDDRVSTDINTPLNSNMIVRVWREGKKTITVDEPIAFETDTIEDIDQSVGYNFVKVAGELGSRSVSYEITIADGVEVGRTEIVSIITKQPKKQIESIGVKGKYTTPSENENITWNYLINQGFSKVQTAGIMGNLQQEHRFRTDGDGLAQWTGGRKANLYSKTAPDNIYTQLDFLMEEFNGGYAYVMNKIKSSNSLSEVTQIFQNEFERCNPYYCMFDQRIDYAQHILGSH